MLDKVKTKQFAGQRKYCSVKLHTCYTFQKLPANLTDKINGKGAIIVFA